MRLEATAVALLLVASAFPRLSLAQPVRGAGATISGRVIDAATGRPLAAATVVLYERDGAAAPLARADTRADGVYVIQGLDRRSYRAVIRKLGYRPTSIAVTLGDSSTSEVSIGLEVAPIFLEPTFILGVRPRDFGLPGRQDTLQRDARLEEARLRREEFLATDAREITAGDVLESVTLGEPDLFRSLHRLPGVTAAEDYSAEFWTRGARWDLTRVAFDGVPIFGPLHGFGLVSVIPMDVVGSATFFPGVAPISSVDGAAGVLDLRTRAGRRGVADRGSAEISLLGARATVSGGSDDGARAWMLSGRRSYLDLAVSAVEGLVGGEDLQVPYHFGDVVARYEQQVGRHRLEASTLMTRDRVTADVPDLLQGYRVVHGNLAAQLSLRSTTGRLEVKQRLGMSRLRSRVDSTTADSVLLSRYVVDEPAIGGGTLLAVQWSVEVAPVAEPGKARWRAGSVVERETSDLRGQLNAALNDVLDRAWITTRSGSRRGTLWYERRFAATRLQSLVGVRATLADGVIRPAPRAELAFTPHRTIRASAGVSRRYLFAQPLESWSRLSRSTLWIAAGDSIPPARADIATAGLEATVGAWSFALSVYDRVMSGLLLGDPSPGPIPERDAWVLGRDRARGTEWSARRIAGRVTGSASYSRSNARTTTAGRTFPSSADRRHSVDVAGTMTITRKLSLAVASTWMSGAPFTRTTGGVIARDSVTGVRSWTQMPVAGEPNRHRAPSYSSVDLLLNRRFVRARTSWDVYLQVRNALNHRNTDPFAARGLCRGDVDAVTCPGALTNGLPRLPAIGVRALF